MGAVSATLAWSWILAVKPASRARMKARRIRMFSAHLRRIRRMRRISRMCARQRPPWRSAFIAQRALPASVRGPVDRRQGLSRRAMAD
jgi:hypothetical protein